MNEQTNSIHLVGRVTTEPKKTHTVMNEAFYEFMLEVSRNSDKCDVLPIVISERIMPENIAVGNYIEIHGEIRTRNETDSTTNRSKLKITVFVKEIGDAVDYSMNEVEIQGFVCKPPVYRVTPFGREVCDVLLAVNRRTGKSDYIPCIVWSRNARFVSEIPVGTPLTFVGRLQSREYEKNVNGSPEKRVAYELSVARIESGDESDAEE